jgi:hypothetical protein
MKIRVHHVSNSSILIKILDSSVLSGEILLGFVDIPLRLEKFPIDILETTPFRDGNGILTYQIECHPLPLTNLVPVSDQTLSLINLSTRIGLYHSLLPRETNTIFLREFENCFYSRRYSNYFAINAVHDFEDLFGTSRTSLFSSSQHHNHHEGKAMIHSNPFSTDHQEAKCSSPRIIDGRVEGTVTSVLFPTNFVEIPHSVFLLRLHTQTGIYFEKKLELSSCRTINISWDDLISTDCLDCNGITIDLCESVPPSLSQRSNTPRTTPRAGGGGQQLLSSMSLLGRAHFLYSDLIQQGKYSTGVNGEMIVDNKLRLPPAQRRLFQISLLTKMHQNTIPPLEEKWTISNAIICYDSDEAEQAMSLSGLLATVRSCSSIIPTPEWKGGEGEKFFGRGSDDILSVQFPSSPSAIDDSCQREKLENIPETFFPDPDSDSFGSVADSQENFPLWDEVVSADCEESNVDLPVIKTIQGQKLQSIEILENETKHSQAEYLVIDFERESGNMMLGWCERVSSSCESDHSKILWNVNHESKFMKTVSSCAGHLRVLVPIPISMLQETNSKTNLSPPLSFILPRHSGASTEGETIVTISSLPAPDKEQEQNEKIDDVFSTTQPAYGVHLRWTVSTPHLFNEKNILWTLCNKTVKDYYFNTSLAMNAFSMTFSCHERDKVVDDEDPHSSFLINFAPSSFQIELSPTAPTFPSVERQVGTQENSEEISEPIPEEVIAYLSKLKPHEPKLDDVGFQKKYPSIDSRGPRTYSCDSGDYTINSPEDEDDEEEEEEEKTLSFITVDLKPFLRVEESPHGFTLSLDVYENQFLLVPSSNQLTSLKGQKWMPLGTLSSLKSSQLISRYYTYSSLDGVDEFPTYASLCQSDDQENDAVLETSLNNIFDDKIEFRDFEIISEWMQIRAFGSKLYTSTSLGNDPTQSSHSDDFDHDDSWWYAMSLENLLSNTSCYQSFYPKCFYRRRCWRKNLRYKFDSILPFHRIHRLLDPSQASTRQRRSTSSRQPHNNPQQQQSTCQWKWNELGDVQVLSPTVLQFTIQGDQRRFEVDPCPAHSLAILLRTHKSLHSARELIATVSPSTHNGRRTSRYHSNRIDSSGFISLVMDTHGNNENQLNLQEVTDKLRDLIEEYTITMIQNLGQQSLSDDQDSHNNHSKPFFVDLSLFSSLQHPPASSSRDIMNDCETHLTPSSQPTLLTLRFPEKHSNSNDEVNLAMLVVERMIGYYRLISGYTQHGSLLSQTSHQFSLVPSITRLSSLSPRGEKKPPYLPSDHFASRDSPEPERETQWTIAEDEKMVTNPGESQSQIIMPFSFPSYSTQDCVAHIHRLMRVAENSILCLQKSLFLDSSRYETTSTSGSSLEKCEVKYQDRLSSYASDCVYQVVSLIRSLIIWDTSLPYNNSSTNRLGPWNEDYMPLTRFILKNNLRLMFCLLAVTTTSPFRIDRIPCFSRYIGIRSLVIWEMRSRVLGLYEWIKVLRNGSVYRLLEVGHTSFIFSHHHVPLSIDTMQLLLSVSSSRRQPESIS